jgi:hypothetical protein
VGVPVFLAIYTKYIRHFRFFSFVKEHLFIVSFFHGYALLFFVKIVKRAFEFGDPLGYEVEIEQGGFYG